METIAHTTNMVLLPAARISNGLFALFEGVIKSILDPYLVLMPYHLLHGSRLEP